MAKRVPPKKTPTTGKRGGSVDEAAAFAFYCEARSDGKRNSHAEVAKHFGIARQTISLIAKKNDWAQKREDIAKTAIIETTKTLGEQLKAKNEEHLRIFEQVTNDGRTMLAGVMVALGKRLTGEKIRKGELGFSPVTADIAKNMIVDGIKGQRVALGLPTDVTKSMALNLNLTDELPRDELEKMQRFLDANFNKRNTDDNGKQVE